MTPVRPSAARVLVVGVGGLGAPAAWRLAEAGAGRIRLVDPDRIEASNLPRQVLFGLGDAGRSKASVASRRLARPGTEIEAVVARFDETTASRLLAGVDVAIDGTDGAATKDFVNEAAVRAGVPLVHAAALGSEGRVLEVPAGGRPCLACLFGRLAAGGEEGDTCSRLGVWPGAAGAAGALAADAALALLARPAGPSRGLLVLDLGAGRSASLRARADDDCPVCGAERGRAPLAALRGPATDRPPPPPAPEGVLDLREETCPMNLLRARRGVERARPGDAVEIWVGEDGRETVPEGIAAQGHVLLEQGSVPGGERVLVRRGRGAAAAPAGSDDWLRRYARQIVMPEVGEDGQRRWNDATVALEGEGAALAAATLHLAAAGVGRLRLSDPHLVGERAGRFPFEPGDEDRGAAEALAAFLRRHAGTEAEGSRSEDADPSRLVARVGDRTLARPVGRSAQADGALLADHALRTILLGDDAPPPLSSRADGSVFAD